MQNYKEITAYSKTNYTYLEQFYLITHYFSRKILFTHYFLGKKNGIAHT